MKNVKRVMLGALVVACLAFSGIILAACGGANDEQAIRDGLSAELDVIKNLDTATLTDMLADEDDTIQALEQMGISGEDFLRNFFDGFDYEISEVTVDGDNAEATIVLTCKSEQEFESAFSEAMSTQAASMASMTEDEMYKKVGQIAMDTLSGLQPTQSEPITISLTKTNGNWSEDVDTTLKVMNAMMSM